MRNWNELAPAYSPANPSFKITYEELKSVESAPASKSITGFKITYEELK